MKRAPKNGKVRKGNTYPATAALETLSLKAERSKCAQNPPSASRRRRRQCARSVRVRVGTGK